MLRYLPICLIFITVINAVSLLHGQTPRVLKLEADFAKNDREDLTTFGRNKIPMGEVTAGEKVQVHLRLHNRTETAITFGKISPNYYVENLKFKGNEIPAQGFLDVAFDWQAPQSMRQTKNAMLLTFDDSRGSVRYGVRNFITLEYSLSNMVDLAESMVILQVSKENPIAEVKVPLVFSAPIEFDDLQLNTASTIRDLPIDLEEIRGATGKAHLSISASLADVQNGSISGEVQVKNNRGQFKAGLRVIVRELKPFQIQPETIRFREQSSDSKRFIASVMLGETQITPSTTKPEGVIDESSEMKVDAFLNGQRVEIKTYPIERTSTQRVSIVLSRDQAEQEGEQSIRWLIAKDGRTIEFHTPIVFKKN